MLIEASFGEVLDKLSILQIKKDALQPSDPRFQLVQHERACLLVGLADEGIAVTAEDLQPLKTINKEIWDVLDEQFKLDKVGDFGERFLELAKTVYRLNARRAEEKDKINCRYNSKIREVKIY